MTGSGTTHRPFLIEARKGIDTDAARPNTFKPKSFDADAGTVEAVFATETPVRRWYGREVLECTAGAVDLANFRGAPVLDSHNRGSIKSIIGRIESVRVSGRQLVGRFRFSDSDEGRAAKDAVAQGMIRSVSVGYAIVKYEENRTRDGDMERLITKWRPYEISLVGLPADPQAKIRSKETHVMPHEEIETVDNLQDEQRARPRRQDQSENRMRQRIDEIRSRAIDAGLAEVDVDGLLEDVSTADQARAAVFDALADRSRRVIIGNDRGRENSGSGQAEIRNHAIDAIAVKLGATSAIEAGERNPMAGQSVAGIFRGLMESSGFSCRSLDDHQVIDEVLHGTRAAHTTSDFPLLFEDASQRVLDQKFQTARSPIKALSKKRNVRDFRPVNMIKPGGFPKHQKVAEDGEIRYGTMDFEKEVMQATSWAVAIAITRQVLVNDDLGAVADLLDGAGDAAINDEGDMFYALLAENGLMGRKTSDNKTFFHADHGNLATNGAAPDISTLSAARQAMRLQKGVDGKRTAGTAPAVLLVGPKLETTAQQLVASLTASTVGEVNPFAGKLTVEVEDRYDGLGWWLFADPRSRPAFVHGYLDGNIEGPRIRIDEPFGRQGMSMSSEFDFGCGVYDWRAAYFNPGE